MYHGVTLLSRRYPYIFRDNNMCRFLNTRDDKFILSHMGQCILIKVFRNSHNCVIIWTFFARKDVTGWQRIKGARFNTGGRNK